jgi:hypothetical protein
MSESVRHMFVQFDTTVKWKEAQEKRHFIATRVQGSQGSTPTSVLL